jgi:hypothetical protein
MNKLWKWFLPGHVWLLPFTVGYALFCFIAYGARSWGFRNGVVVAIGGTRPNGSTRIWGNPGAQTIGACTVFASTIEENRDDLHAHENCHVVEAMCFGLGGAALTPVVFALLSWSPLWGLALGGFIGAVLYSLAYGVCFLALWIAAGFGPWHASYRKNPFEVLAYSRQAKYVAMSSEQRSRVWT